MFKVLFFETKLVDPKPQNSIPRQKIIYLALAPLGFMLLWTTSDIEMMKKKNRFSDN
jgi:hypothetical protein